MLGISVLGKRFVMHFFRRRASATSSYGQRSMKRYQNLCLTICFAIFLSAGLSSPASTAQSVPSASAKPESPAPSDEGWHLDVTPYLWFAGVHGTAGVQGHDASVHADASDVLSNFNIGFMGVVEPRYNRVLFPTDFMWIKLTDNRALPSDVDATSAKAEFKQTIFTPSIGYRLVDAKKIKVDWKMGIRYWHLDSSLSLQPSGQKVSGSADWVDGVSGGKIETLVARKVIVTIGGDAGGGTSRSDYQVYGLVGFRVARKWTLNAGYRYMSVNYRPESTFVYDMTLSGLILGATWNTK